MVKTVAEKESAKAAKEAEKESAKAGRDSATVTWRGGTRTYTKALHGADLVALAEEFAGKMGGTVA